MMSELWAARDGNGALYLFDHEPWWVDSHEAWDCNRCGHGGSLWMQSADMDTLPDLAPGEKYRVKIVREVETSDA